MSQVLTNVRKLYETYGERIKSDQHLILLYWKEVDGLNITKESVPTQEILRATSPIRIIQAKNAYEILIEEGNE